MAAVVTTQRIGRDSNPLVVIDGFAADPERVRTEAIAACYGPAAHYYPGVRAELHEDYLAEQLPIVAEVIRTMFGRPSPVTVVDASFSVVTTPPAELSVRQRLPHCDAFTADRIALVHFLSPAASDDGGTAFYRHRSTGFEWVDEARAPIFFGQLEAELRHRGVPQGYIHGDTDLFERIAHVPARANRALVYRGYQLHSGAIPPGMPLPADATTGRLTVTAFLSTGGVAATLAEA